MSDFYHERVRISDVAAALNLSRGTVDRALHNRPGIKPEIRELVLREAEKMGYRTNRAARFLALKKSSTVGVLIPSEPKSYWGGVKEGFRRAAAEFVDLGVKCVFYSTEIRDPKRDAAWIHQAIADGVDALALTTFNHEEIREQIAGIVDAGIPVVTFVTDVPGSKRLAFVGNNPEKEGRVAGEIMGKLLQGQGNVMIFRGKSGLNSSARRSGFTQVINRDYPGVRITHEEELYLAEDTGSKVREALSGGASSLHGIFVANSLTDIIAIELKELGLDRQVKLVGFDLTNVTETCLKSGVVDVVITQNSFRLGYETFKLLADYLLEGKQPPADTLQGSIEIIFREMLD